MMNYYYYYFYYWLNKAYLLQILVYKGRNLKQKLLENITVLQMRTVFIIKHVYGYIDHQNYHINFTPP